MQKNVKSYTSVIPLIELIDRIRFATVFLFTGLALLLYIYTGINLGIILLVLGLAGATYSGLRIRAVDADIKMALYSRVLLGVRIGLISTAVYDVLRIVLYCLKIVEVYPFEAFNLFGQAILGTYESSQFAFAVGTMSHVLNGVCFSISYCILMQGKPFYWGMLWGLGLQSTMMMVYPNWLQLSDSMTDFIIISMVGHWGYGLALGLLNRAKNP